MGALAPEYPTTDAEEIKNRLDVIVARLDHMDIRLDGQATGINNIGENLQWLVQNVQGIFQMFASPQFMSQMSNMIAGGIGNAGQAGEPASEPASGTESGGS
jgi:hypothetical protein